MTLDYESLATGRTVSLFQNDVEANARALSAALENRSVAVIGAAGSIGGAVVKNLLRFHPARLALIDLSENNLTELVRDLRAASDMVVPARFTALPIGLGSPECLRFFSGEDPFDYVFNLCAVKHVRSEKDVFSLMHMIDTNILFLDELLASLRGRSCRVFSVSTDKATNPVSMMGASKQAMEMVLLRHSDQIPFSTARFANVAFSDGSLLFGFLKRIEKRQPIAAPNDVRRFFISHQEAGQLCLLAGILGDNREVFFPCLERGRHEKKFSEIAVELLHGLGYEPYECGSEEEAKSRFEELIAEKKWPCLFAPADTAGEKPYEEFFAAGDEVDLSRFRSIGVIRHAEKRVDRARLDSFLRIVRRARTAPIPKAAYLSAFRDLIPEFDHVETGRILDEKM